MKKISLTQGQFAVVDDADFEQLNQFKWFAHKRTGNFYAVRRKDGKHVSMHRELLGITDPSILGDHKDRNTLNNQRNNLRKASRSQNNANTRSRNNSVSKYLGVSPFVKNGKSKWRANICKDKKIYHLGYFKTEEDAALAYNKKALELHGEFANLNQV